MNTKKDKTTSVDWGSVLRQASVPIMFIIICAICIPISGLSANMLINEIVTRMGRNSFLILSLLIPIMAGMSGLKVGKYALRALQGVEGYGFSGTEIGLLIVGSLVSFLISFACIRFLMDFVRRHSFEVFGWYRIALGVLVVLYFSIFA
jgi:undecaprenyl pyrophosphate phosphatase UppP